MFRLFEKSRPIGLGTTERIHQHEQYELSLKKEPSTGFDPKQQIQTEEQKVQQFGSKENLPAFPLISERQHNSLKEPAQAEKSLESPVITPSGVMTLQEQEELKRLERLFLREKPLSVESATERENTEPLSVAPEVPLSKKAAEPLPQSISPRQAQPLPDEALKAPVARAESLTESLLTIPRPPQQHPLILSPLVEQMASEKISKVVIPDVLIPGPSNPQQTNTSPTHLPSSHSVNVDVSVSVKTQIHTIQNSAQALLSSVSASEIKTVTTTHIQPTLAQISIGQMPIEQMIEKLEKAENLPVETPKPEARETQTEKLGETEKTKKAQKKPKAKPVDYAEQQAKAYESYRASLENSTYALPFEWVVPKERLYGSFLMSLGIVFYVSLLGFIGITLWETGNPTVLALTLLAGVAFLMHRGLVQGQLRGNAVKISEKQFPELMHAAKNVAASMYLHTLPDLYVTSQEIPLSKLAKRFAFYNAVVLPKSLIEQRDQQPEAVDFIIATALAKVKQSHNTWHWLSAPVGFLLPLLGKAYGRASTLTCDRIAAHAVPSGAWEGMKLLALSSGKLADELDIDTCQSSLKEQRNLWSKFAETISSQPHLSTRFNALLALAIVQKNRQVQTSELIETIVTEAGQQETDSNITT